MTEKDDFTMTAITDALTAGLMTGFCDPSAPASIDRGSFSFNKSHVENEVFTYHDEWLAAAVGGGQETLKVSGYHFTRLYAGGTIQANKLADLGISESDVIEFLKSILIEKKSCTRLLVNCCEQTGEWTYTYEVIAEFASISLTVGKETIAYKGQEVFVHVFILCPVV